MYTKLIHFFKCPTCFLLKTDKTAMTQNGYAAVTPTIGSQNFNKRC